MANSPEPKLYPSGCFAPTPLSSTPTLSRWDNPRNTQVGLHLLERETELTFQVEDLFSLVFLSTDAACLDECFSCFLFSFLIYGICSFLSFYSLFQYFLTNVWWPGLYKVSHPTTPRGVPVTFSWLKKSFIGRAPGPELQKESKVGEQTRS